MSVGRRSKSESAALLLLRDNDGTAFAFGWVVDHSTRSAVAVSGLAQRANLLDALMLDGNDYGVIILESIADAYSRIREMTPDLVIVYLEIDDAAACQLLSMLTIDSETSRIPVVTWTARYDKGGLEDIIAAAIRDDSLSQVAALPMN
jgi:DNA-binding response OmpR family regulator